jgi:hypothetical protein
MCKKTGSRKWYFREVPSGKTPRVTILGKRKCQVLEIPGIRVQRPEFSIYYLLFSMK